MPRRIRQQRSGTTLILFALLLFALLGMAALVLDAGMARLTQVQMQSATDSAALEGLRFRDDNPLADDGVDLNLARRQAASSRITHVFDDDLLVDAQQHRFGAGPAMQLVGGQVIDADSGLRAFTTIQFDDPAFYRPVPRLNEDNQDRAGDLVGGSYSDGDSVRHRENSAYQRDDFQLEQDTKDQDAFLARLRRSNETFDDQNKSNGPPLQGLFSRATLLSPQAKERGITVRATSIAAIRSKNTNTQFGRVKFVGSPLTKEETGTKALPGVVPFVIFKNEWKNLPDTFLKIQVSSKSDNRVEIEFPEDTRDVGNLLGRLDDDELPAIAIGQVRSPESGNLTYKNTIGYLPIIEQSTDVVIGFGAVEFKLEASSANMNPEDAPTIISQLKKRSAILIAAENVSAIVPPGISTTDLNDALNKNLDPSLEGLLYTPVLVRSLGPSQ